MIASRLIAFAAAAFAGFTMVAATPVASDIVVKRQASVEDQVIAVLDQLSLDTDGPVNGIDSVVASGSVSEASLAPHFTTLLSQIDGATAAISAIEPAALARFATRTDPKHDYIALCLCKIIEKIVKVLYKLLVFVVLIPKLLIWFAACDKAISLLLIAVGVLIKVILGLVAKLLVTVLFILQALLFTLTCKCLGL